MFRSSRIVKASRRTLAVSGIWLYDQVTPAIKTELLTYGPRAWEYSKFEVMGTKFDTIDAISGFHADNSARKPSSWSEFVKCLDHLPGKNKAVLKPPHRNIIPAEDPLTSTTKLKGNIENFIGHGLWLVDKYYVECQCGKNVYVARKM